MVWQCSSIHQRKKDKHDVIVRSLAKSPNVKSLNCHTFAADASVACLQIWSYRADQRSAVPFPSSSPSKPLRHHLSATPLRVLPLTLGVVLSEKWQARESAWKRLDA